MFFDHYVNVFTDEAGEFVTFEEVNRQEQTGERNGYELDQCYDVVSETVRQWRTYLLK
ncbi:hypothetical protein LJR022_009615 [Paraburkholderia hospita]|uniref:hypothetical protein n=1 Tax=Paraburkholderia hospita TaxID=169430 RepID=UPI003ED0F6E9